METFHIINQIPKNLIPVKTGLIETYLDGLHLEIYVVENLPRNLRTLLPARREDRN